MKLFLAGDVMIGRGVDQILPEPCDPALHEAYLVDAREYVALAEARTGPIPRRAEPAYPWGIAPAALAAAGVDARIVNLETSLTRAGAYDRRKGIHYRASPENARCLAAAGLDACVLANNHVLDWGVPGLLDTLATLDALGIAHAGAGRDRDAALAPAVVAGGRVVVFAIGCRDAGVPARWGAADGPGVAFADELGGEDVRRLRRAIAPWRRDGAIVVVSLHWGGNWDFDIPREHRRFAHRLIDDAGVHVVHGHSSHHVKGIEVHAGQPILYGCGDLLTDYEGIGGHERFHADASALYLVTLDASGALAELELVPTRVQHFRIAHATSDDVRWLAATLAHLGRPLGTSVAIAGERMHLVWSPDR